MTSDIDCSGQDDCVRNERSFDISKQVKTWPTDDYDFKQIELMTREVELWIELWLCDWCHDGVCDVMWQMCVLTTSWVLYMFS